MNLICNLNLEYHVTLEVDFHYRQSISLTSCYFPLLLSFPFLLSVRVISQGGLWPQEASKDEYGEEDHGPAATGGVQPAGQRAGPHAPAPPLLGALPPTTPYDTERAGGETLHDAACFQPGERDNRLLIETASSFKMRD